MIGALFSLFIWVTITTVEIGLLVALKVFEWGFLLLFSLSEMVVNGIVSILGVSPSLGSSSMRKAKPVTATGSAKSEQVRSNSEKMSRRQRKEMDKSIKREVNRAHDAMEDDLFMVMEVFADD